MSLVAEDIKYIAIQGAGGKGAAYLGVLQALEEEGILPNDKDSKTNIKGISGTSAGCITALMVSLGFSAKEVEKIAIEKSWFEKTLKESYYRGRYRAYKNYSSKHKASIKEYLSIGFFNENSNLKGAKTNFQDKMTLSNNYILFDENPVKSLSPIKAGKHIKGSFKKYAFHYFVNIILHNIEEFVSEIDTSDIKRRINPMTMNILEEVCLELSRKLDYVVLLVSKAGLEEPHFLVDMSLLLKKEPNSDEEAIWTILLMWFIEFIVIPKLIKFIEALNMNQTEECTISDYETRRTQEHWAMLKVYFRLFIGVNVGRRGGNIPKSAVHYLDNIMEKIDIIVAFDFKDNKGAIQLDPLEAMYEFFGIIAEIHLLFSAAEKKYSVLKNILKALIAPLKAMLHDGGILGGARVRYALATCVYMAVEIEYKKDGNEYKPSGFKKREESEKTIRLTEDTSIVNMLDKGKFAKYSEDEIKKAREYLYIQHIKSNSNKDKEIELNKDIRIIVKGSDSVLNKARIICLKSDLLYLEQHFSFEKHKEIFDIDLVICTANVSNKSSTYFNPHITPDFPVVEACAMSMSIPGLWKPTAVEYMPKDKTKMKKSKAFYKKNYRGWFVDGGIFENLPLHAFNGYQKNKFDYTPQDLSESISDFPHGKIFGISYKSSHCEFSKAGKDGKSVDEVDHMSMFCFTQKGFMSIFLDILGGLFEYSTKLRGINKNQKYSDCIVRANSGYLGMLTFNISNKQMCAFCQNVIKTKKETLKIFGKEMDIDEKKCKKECK